MIRRPAALGALALALALVVGGAAGGSTAAAATAAAPARRNAAPVVDTVFRRGFAFCRDPHYALTPDEVEWCALMPKQSDPRCPHIREACGQGATAGPPNSG